MPDARVEGWFADIVPKPSTPSVVLAAVRRAVSELASD